MNIIKDKLLLVDDDEYVHCPCPYGGVGRELNLKWYRVEYLYPIIFINIEYLLISASSTKSR